MRFMTDGKVCVFFCDCCHEILDDDDEGDVVIANTAQSADDDGDVVIADQCECLCQACLAKRGEA